MGTTSLEVGVYNSGTGQIDWLERNFYTDVFNLSINDALGSGADTASFGMKFPVSYVEGGGELPLSGQILRITVEDVKLFQGIIEPIDQAWLGGGVSLDLSVSATSEIGLLNRHLVVKVYDAEETAGERIKRILQEFAPDFADDLSRIASATVVPAKTYDYQAVASTISEVARGVGYMWDLDYDKRIHFFADMENPAPIAAIDLDTDLVVGDVEVHTTPVEANVIIVKDFVSKSDNSYRHETAADGYSSFFKLPLEPFSIDDTDVFVRSGDAGTADWVQRTLIDDPLDGSPESIEGTEGLAYLCFGAQTPVLKDLWSVPIEELSVGDRVWGGYGKRGVVTATFSRLYQGDMVTLTYKDDFRPLRVTAGHKVLIVRREKCLRRDPRREHKRDRQFPFPTLDLAEWMAAEDILLGDYLVRPRLTSDALPPEAVERLSGLNGITADLMWLGGLYLADGYMSKGGRPLFALHEDETDIVERIRSVALDSFGARCTVYQRKASKGITVRVKSKQLGRFLGQAFGHYARGKRVGSWIPNLPEEHRVELFRGYWQGDGLTSYAQILAHSVSLELLEGMRCVLESLGCAAPLRKRVRDVPTPQGTWYKQHVLYELRVGAESAERLFGLLGLEKSRKTWRKKDLRVTDEAVFIAVTDVRKEKSTEVVYNVTVEPGHTILATSCVGQCIHNWGVRFPTSDMPMQFDGVRVDYDPAIPDRVTVVFDEDSIRECARREGGDGRHELVVSASDFRVRNENPIAALGQLILDRKAWPVVTGSFFLRATSIGEWAPGETFTIESTKRDIFDVRQWVASNYTSKQPVRVWVTGVDRTFELHDTGIVEKNIVSFSSQPWQ